MKDLLSKRFVKQNPYQGLSFMQIQDTPSLRVFSFCPFEPIACKGIDIRCIPLFAKVSLMNAGKLIVTRIKSIMSYLWKVILFKLYIC